jgi:hypothetical protein
MIKAKAREIPKVFFDIVRLPPFKVGILQEYCAYDRVLRMRFKSKQSITPRGYLGGLIIGLYREQDDPT